MNDKFIVLVFALAFAVSMVFSCASDAECNVDECCRRLIPDMPFMRCSSLAEPKGRCGGQTRCQCIPGFECVLDEPGFFNKIRVGNGSCKPVRQMQQDAFKTFVNMQ